jgi:hypothetical protein
MAADQVPPAANEGASIVRTRFINATDRQTDGHARSIRRNTAFVQRPPECTVETY